MKSRVSDPVKVQQWSERLSRFGDSGQTVAEFCRAECVSQPSFYGSSDETVGNLQVTCDPGCQT